MTKRLAEASMAPHFPTDRAVPLREGDRVYMDDGRWAVVIEVWPFYEQDDWGFPAQLAVVKTWKAGSRTVAAAWLRPIPGESAIERFWSNVDRSGECWLWTAQHNGRYGTWQPHRDRKMGAHRFAYEIVYGEIPVGLEIDHTCRNPLCVRPDHLEPVTSAENSQRALARQRAAA